MRNPIMYLMRSLMNKIMTILLLIYLLYLMNLMMTHMSLPRHQTNNCYSRFITNIAQDRSQTQKSLLVPRIPRRSPRYRFRL